MILAFSQPDGSEIPGIIRSVAGDSVTVDFNHPLAGQTVIFDVEIVDVKPCFGTRGKLIMQIHLANPRGFAQA